MTKDARALALAIKRGEWERVGLCLLLGLSLAAQEAPPETVDLLLELVSGEAPPRARRRRERP